MEKTYDFNLMEQINEILFMYLEKKSNCFKNSKLVISNLKKMVPHHANLFFSELKLAKTDFSTYYRHHPLTKPESLDASKIFNMILNSYIDLIIEKFFSNQGTIDLILDSWKSNQKFLITQLTLIFHEEIMQDLLHSLKCWDCNQSAEFIISLINYQSFKLKSKPVCNSCYNSKYHQPPKSKKNGFLHNRFDQFEDGKHGIIQSLLIFMNLDNPEKGLFV